MCEWGGGGVMDLSFTYDINYTKLVPDEMDVDRMKIHKF